MRTSIARRRSFSAARLLLLASLLVVTLAPAVRPLAAPSAPPGTVPAARAIGSGPFDTFACLGCAGVVVGLGGTTVLGVIGFLAAWPEVGIGCGLVCYKAFW